MSSALVFFSQRSCEHFAAIALAATVAAAAIAGTGESNYCEPCESNGVRLSRAVNFLSSNKHSPDRHHFDNPHHHHHHDYYDQEELRCR